MASVAQASAKLEESVAGEARLEAPYVHGGGFQWIATLPPNLPAESDTAAAPYSSRLVLLENGRELGPAHALHERIRNDGGGAYSHWNGPLLFSTSDGTDPNTNGRIYSVRLAPAKLKLLGFGSCHLHYALQSLAARGMATPCWGNPTSSYSAAETLQLIRTLRGETTTPELLRPMTALAMSEGAAESILPPDIAFVEIGTCIDIVFDDVILSRAAVTEHVFGPMIAMGRAEGRIAKKWYHQGLQRFDEPLRAELAEQLAQAFAQAPGTLPVAPAMARGARAFRRERAQILESLGLIAERLGCPICVMTTPALYMPDGRPVSWPAGFPEEVAAICRDEGLPCIELAKLVMERGVERSIEPDLHHYTPAFIDALGDRMLEVAQRLAADVATIS